MGDSTRILGLVCALFWCACARPAEPPRAPGESAEAMPEDVLDRSDPGHQFESDRGSASLRHPRPSPWSGIAQVAGVVLDPTSYLASGAAMVGESHSGKGCACALELGDRGPPWPLVLLGLAALAWGRHARYRGRS